MKISKTEEDGIVTLTLEGWLDTQAAPELEEALKDIRDDISALIFDCSALEYISSSGIRQIVSAHKRMNGNFTLKNVSDEILGVLKVTGIANRIKIE